MRFKICISWFVIIIVFFTFRILKEISDKLRARTPVSEPVFNFLMSYKSAWTRRGYLCNIVKNLLCKKVQEQLGGELQYMIVGRCFAWIELDSA